MRLAGMRPGATRSTGVLAAALLLLLALLLATATEAGVARADGGAPNLVYVAQDRGGLVVLDIARPTDINDTDLYVANAADDSVSVISTKLRRVIAPLPARGGPLGVAIPPAGGVAYVGTRSGAVLAVSLSGHRLLGTVFHLSGPAGAMGYEGPTGPGSVADPPPGEGVGPRARLEAG